ncbi:MAG: type II toxin-antitoxin system HicA family toxin [Patescibacteria group bacterium]|nr:type II toxin-antitoxin system HicA family toxin [Patescibacteria group bacterium]MDE1988629.1 type II toxin-antitoxin system HicA family toxin [Patescibacteria group bacterium]MDE2217915.1 type II toxin-antitoxin system HicA family toxin [Patescibacteria group bacterium]
MPKLLSSKTVIRVLERNGFVFVSQKGSHIKYRKHESAVLTVIIPANKKEVPYGTFRSILRQAQLDEEDFR